VNAGEESHAERQIPDGLDFDTNQLVLRLAHPRASLEPLHDPAVIGLRLHAVSRSQRREIRCPQRPRGGSSECVDAEQVVDRGVVTLARFTARAPPSRRDSEACDFTHD
jgi:hypothetical protein